MEPMSYEQLSKTTQESGKQHFNNPAATYRQH